MGLQTILGRAALLFSGARAQLQPRQSIEVGARWYGGGLTILSDNDLSNSPRNNSAAVLVHQRASYQSAVVACSRLGEDLWNPDLTSRTNSLNSSLSYQVYLGVFPDTQLYWIDSRNATTTCRALDVDSLVWPVDCNIELPALCSQSAAVSTHQTSDTATEFQVDQKVGTQVYTGYRDWFVWKFRGIRFASQPLRFEHSTLYTPNESKPIPALKAGADCLQPIGEVQSGSSEDCLFLNVWTPYLPPLEGSEAQKPKLKPVMLYIYGGGFTSGSGKNSNTDGTNIASRGDVVAISVNYRVSTVGWMAFNDGKHDGNYGLGDIIVALEWVQKNIADLGGDPKRVTIYGESAGGMLVRGLLASPRAKGLFYAAISQSGPTGTAGNEFGSAAYYNTLAIEYEAVSKGILAQAGCGEAEDKLGCMRKANATELINYPTVSRGLVVDNNYILANTLALNNTSGYTADVAFLTGTNRDELGVDVDPVPAGANLTDYFAHRLPGGVGDLSRFVSHPAYRVANASSPATILNATIRISTNALYTCSEAATAYSAARHGAFASVWSYSFNRTYNPAGYTKPHCGPPATETHPHGNPQQDEYFKCHAGEQMIMFGTVRRDNLPDRDGLDVPFMQLVVDYWTAFARARNPNPEKAYLEARGYRSTIAEIGRTGEWKEVPKGEVSTRLLQWGGGQIGRREVEQCDALGLGIDYFEAK